MDIAVIGIGSRGDVQPYLALARGLRHAGHQVRLVAPPNFASLAQQYEIEFCSVGVDFQILLDNERFKSVIESGKLIRSLPALRREFLTVIDDLFLATWQACQGADLVIATVIGPIGYNVAEKLQASYVEAAMQPLTPTRAFPSPVVSPRLRLGGAFNQLTHILFEQALWQLYRANINRLRTELLGLAPHSLTGPLRYIRKRGVLRLYAYSPQVVPRPADWPATHQVTGYWFLPAPAQWQPPPELCTFLEAGEPPIYIGFGSMMSRNPQHMAALVSEALLRTGQRAIVASGWGALNGAIQLSDRVFSVESLPHHWLFPRMRAIVHHGGAGTTGAALHSGVPSVVVPFGFDQAFWGHRVAALGVGPPPLPRPTLTAPQLAAAIERTVNDAGMRERAARLGTQIQAEHGLAQAIDHIHCMMKQKW
jgi:sterol 3beta-glucosyltransferase